MIQTFIFHSNINVIARFLIQVQTEKKTLATIFFFGGHEFEVIWYLSKNKWHQVEWLYGFLLIILLHTHIKKKLEELSFCEGVVKHQAQPLFTALQSCFSATHKKQIITKNCCSYHCFYMFD